MLYIILLLVLAVLLLGSSAVIGALGMILGFIVAAVALIWASIAFDIEPFFILVSAFVGFFALCGLVMLVATTYDAWQANPKLFDLREMTRMGKIVTFGVAAIVALGIGIGIAEMQIRHSDSGPSVRQRVEVDYSPQKQSKDDVAECTTRGVSYFIEIGSYPRLSDGRDAAQVALERCMRTRSAFP